MASAAEDEFAAAVDRAEPWAIAKAWCGAVFCDAHLCELLTTADLWEQAGGDVAGLLAVLPEPDVLEVLQIVSVEPVALDVEWAYLTAGEWVVSLSLLFDVDRRAWRVGFVRTEIMTKESD